MKSIHRMLIGCLTLGIVAPVWAQVDTETAQKKLLSKRAAEADAYRKIAEVVKGLQINSQTYVKDFVTESDEIQAALDTFIRGVRLGEPRWYDDLSCEVPAEVTVAKVIETLREIHTRHYKGDRVKGTDFSDMERRIEKRIIEVVGMGAPREDLPPDLPEGVAEQVGAPAQLPEPVIPDIWRQIGPQGRLMAKRAAELDAKRQLLERIKGLRITSDTLVRDFVTESDQITAQAMGTVRGANIVRTYYHDDEPIVEVTVEVPVETVITIVRELHTRSIQGDRIKGTDVTDIRKSIKGKTFQATGMGVPGPQHVQRYNAQVQVPEEKIPEWATKRITMTGSGVPSADNAGTPQGKLMAARAAELDAKRKLAEHINGLVIHSETRVRDFVTEHDEISSRVDAVLVGAMVEDTRFEGDTAHVTVSVPGMQVWEIVHEYIRIERRRG